MAQHALGAPRHSCHNGPRQALRILQSRKRACTMGVRVARAAVSVAGTTRFPKKEVELKLQYPAQWAASSGTVPCDHTVRISPCVAVVQAPPVRGFSCKMADTKLVGFR